MSDTTGVELFFVVRIASGSDARVHFCVTLSPFHTFFRDIHTPSLGVWRDSRDSHENPSKKNQPFFFWPVGRLVTVNGSPVTEVCTGYEGKMILHFYSVKCLVR